jgi:hypothetical protein
MTTSELPTTLNVKSPADLLSAVPYLLGFRPEESLVVVGVDNSKIIVTARINLPDMHLPGVLRTLFNAVKRGTATAMVIVLVTDTDVDTASVTRSLTEHAEDARLELIDTLLVSGGRWWSLRCHDPACCPAKGNAMPAAPTAIDAAATYRGMTALANRQALRDVFAPLPDRPDLTEELHRYLDIAVLDGSDPGWDRSAARALFAAARGAEAGEWPSDEQVARFGVALLSYPVRDALWLAVDSGSLPGQELWIDLARRLPGRLAAGPLFLAAWRSYRDGDGARAGIAAELALAADPMSTAADLLLNALAYGVDPPPCPSCAVQRHRREVTTHPPPPDRHHPSADADVPAAPGHLAGGFVIPRRRSPPCPTNSNSSATAPPPSSPATTRTPGTSSAPSFPPASPPRTS